MPTILKVKVCDICDEEFLVNYEEGDTDEKECPSCEPVEFIPDDDLTFDTIM